MPPSTASAEDEPPGRWCLITFLWVHPGECRGGEGGEPARSGGSLEPSPGSRLAALGQLPGLWLVSGRARGQPSP